ncbi:DUF4233 domain-containing protein [Nocardioides immobilis]|uniref:DUF4233 domain-containing protein n=1 Tax=Nocardioides immobilis TaxID=2049295 RepID=A0A417Y4V7_9ACTN|nr:DUF4233 domain-containing protein [Nocardioides immobilis]RHW27712.1 DUF4233 domain-containing protein [Nocardioides immobilis]
MRSVRRSLCATVLSVEAITLGLTTPVMIELTDVSTGTALAIGLGLAAACLVTAGLLRAEWGYLLGHTIQVVAVGLGFVVPMMFVLGPILALLWGTAYGVGRKIERERAEAHAVSGESDAERESDV